MDQIRATKNSRNGPPYFRMVIFINYLEKGKTIKSENYIVLLERLKAEITQKNDLTWQGNRYFFTETMQCITNSLCGQIT